MPLIESNSPEIRQLFFIEFFRAGKFDECVCVAVQNSEEDFLLTQDRKLDALLQEASHPLCERNFFLQGAIYLCDLNFFPSHCSYDIIDILSSFFQKVYII